MAPSRVASPRSDRGLTPATTGPSTHSGHEWPFGGADGEVARFRGHGAMGWPRGVASFVEPDRAIALIRE